MNKVEAVDYNPRTWWVGQPSPALQPASMADHTPARRGHRWPWLAGGGLCFAGALAVAWLGRDPVTLPPAPEALAGNGRVAIASREPGTIERTSGLADPAQLAALLSINGFASGDVAGISRAAIARLGGEGPLTVTLSLRAGAAPALLRLAALHQDSSGVVVTPDGAGGWHAEPVARAVRTHLVGTSAQITGDSLYASAVAAGLDEGLLPDFAKAFAYDVDFQADVGPGDTFEMESAQSVNAQDKPVGAPQLVFARLTTQAKSLTVYRFADSGHAAGWYDANGRSVVRAFMRTPVDGARVSSRYGVRVHPILGEVKMHEGVDFAVPLGTPIYAAADGQVLTARRSVTAGNMVELRHDKGLMTRYFHMTRFADGIMPGVRVHQGQVIGLSGSTGRSTGPHLHYELRLDGKAIDPLTYKTEAGGTLTGAALAAFRVERARIDAARAHQDA